MKPSAAEFAEKIQSLLTDYPLIPYVSNGDAPQGMDCQG